MNLAKHKKSSSKQKISQDVVSADQISSETGKEPLDADNSDQEIDSRYSGPGLPLDPYPEE